MVGEQPVHIAESALDHLQPSGELLGQRTAALDGGGVAVDADHAAGSRLQQGAAVAAGAEGAVHIEAAVARDSAAITSSSRTGM